MTSSKKKMLLITMLFLVLFVIFTILVKVVDVQKIGPLDSEVGFASINESFHNMFDYNETFYKISKILGYLSFIIIGVYGLTGLLELIKEKSIFKVNKKVLLMGGFYALVLFVYFLFEKIVINYRPVLEEGKLEASYPSSHTILAICVCVSSILASRKIFKNKRNVKLFNIITALLMLGIVITRLLSGVHWLTDICGGILISVFLCSLFNCFLNNLKDNT